MGHGRFILFYLTCGVIAVFAQALPDPSSAVPMVGASGAISGVLGAYLLLCLLPLSLGLVTLTGFALLPLLLVPPVGYLIYWLVWKEFHH